MIFAPAGGRDGDSTLQNEAQSTYEVPSVQDSTRGDGDATKKHEYASIAESTAAGSQHSNSDDDARRRPLPLLPKSQTPPDNGGEEDHVNRETSRPSDGMTTTPPHDTHGTGGKQAGRPVASKDEGESEEVVEGDRTTHPRNAGAGSMQTPAGNSQGRRGDRGKRRSRRKQWSTDPKEGDIKEEVTDLALTQPGEDTRLLVSTDQGVPPRNILHRLLFSSRQCPVYAIENNPQSEVDYISDYRNDRLTLVFVILCAAGPIIAGLQFWQTDPSDTAIVSTACNPRGLSPPLSPCVIGLALLRAAADLSIRGSAISITQTISTILRVGSINVQIHAGFICTSALSMLLAEAYLVSSYARQIQREKHKPASQAYKRALLFNRDGSARSPCRIIGPAAALSVGAVASVTATNVVNALTTSATTACLTANTTIAHAYVRSLCTGEAISGALSMVPAGLLASIAWGILAALLFYFLLLAVFEGVDRCSSRASSTRPGSI